jgi:cytochrome c-type protein NapC
MEPSTLSDPFVFGALACAALSCALLVWYLVRHPPLNRATKIVLLLGIGLLPLATAGSGNIGGFHATKTTRFCRSCHVMTPYGDDSRDPLSTSLAARHTRNEAFGAENCYTCHADYGMFGTVTTKLGGLRHVYEYSLNYRDMPVDDFLVEVKIREPFPSSTCIRCHSTKNPSWNAIGDHASMADKLRAGLVSCASEGCHGFAHPFSKDAKRRAGHTVGVAP